MPFFTVVFLYRDGVPPRIAVGGERGRQGGKKRRGRQGGKEGEAGRERGRERERGRKVRAHDISRHIVKQAKVRPGGGMEGRKEEREKVYVCLSTRGKTLELNALFAHSRGEIGGELERDIVSCAEMMWMLSVEPSKRGLVSSRSCQLEGMAQAGLARRGWPKPFMLKADTRTKYCSPCEEGRDRGKGGREGREKGRE